MRPISFAMMAAALALAACADKSEPAPAAPAAPVAPAANSQQGFDELQALLERGTPDEKRQAIASLTIAQCMLQNVAEDSFRSVAAGADGLESRGRTSDGVDVYVDAQVGMMLGLSDELCHVMIQGSNVAGLASMVEPSLGFGSTVEPRYALSGDTYGVRFPGSKGEKFLSVVKADTVPGTEDGAAVSVFVIKE